MVSGGEPSARAITPTSCQRRPSPYSLTSKWVDSDGKLTGAHSQKNCASPSGAPVGEAQFFWLWAPVNFPSLSTHFDVNEYGDGRRWHEVGVIARADGSPPETMRRVDYRVDWRPGTRWAQRFEYDLVDSHDRLHTVALVPRYEFQMCGLGYGHPDFGHGVWKGESVVASERIALPVETPCSRQHIHV